MAKVTKKKKAKLRIHSQTPVIEKLYKKMSRRNRGWVSPQLMLEELFEIYNVHDGNEEDTAQFAVLSVERAEGHNNPKSVFYYSIRDTRKRKMSFARFWNIISELNGEHT